MHVQAMKILQCTDHITTIVSRTNKILQHYISLYIELVKCIDYVSFTFSVFLTSSWKCSRERTVENSFAALTKCTVKRRYKTHLSSVHMLVVIPTILYSLMALRTWIIKVYWKSEAFVAANLYSVSWWKNIFQIQQAMLSSKFHKKLCYCFERTHITCYIIQQGTVHFAFLCIT